MIMPIGNKLCDICIAKMKYPFTIPPLTTALYSSYQVKLSRDLALLICCTILEHFEAHNYSVAQNNYYQDNLTVIPVAK